MLVPKKALLEQPNQHRLLRHLSTLQLAALVDFSSHNRSQTTRRWLNST